MSVQGKWLGLWAGAWFGATQAPEPPEPPQQPSGGGILQQAAKSERQKANERAELLRRIGLEEVEPVEVEAQVSPPRRVTSLRDLASLLPPREAPTDEPAQVAQTGTQQSLTRVAAEIAASEAKVASIGTESEAAGEEAKAADAAIMRRENNNRAAILIALLMANA